MNDTTMQLKLFYCHEPGHPTELLPVQGCVSSLSPEHDSPPHTAGICCLALVCSKAPQASCVHELQGAHCIHVQSTIIMSKYWWITYSIAQIVSNKNQWTIWSCNWNSRPGISILVHSKNILNNLKKSKMIGFKNKKDWSWTASNTCKIISLRNMSSKQKTYIWWWWRHQGMVSVAIPRLIRSSVY